MTVLHISEKNSVRDDGVVLLPTDTSPKMNAKGMRADEIRVRLEEVSSVASLEEIGSAEYKALNWLISSDSLKLHADDDHIVQRYVLALVWFSTKGGSWRHTELDWLTPKHECHWTTSVNQAQIGVLDCDENGEITRLHLGRCVRLPLFVPILTDIRPQLRTTSSVDYLQR